MESAYGTSMAGGEAAASSGFNPTITGGDMGLGGGPGMGLGGGPDMGLAQFAGPTSAESTGMMSWLKNNPMATLMLGQSLSGAAQSYSMEKAASDDRAFERERLANRGLGGFDSQGNYAGIVSSQQAPTPESAVAEPVVQKPQVAAIQPQTVAPIQTPTQTPAPPQQQTVPVSRDQLPKLNQSGQIARG
jgi:hypothetical protein